ncbi:MBL fold metallo-hydrolase [Staphylococcus succinus]|nr:MBL fold metallo-hydrolase [Staphylococcus succinus]
MSSSIKVHVLHTGSVIVDEALPFNYKSNPPFAWTGLFRSKKKQMRLPVSIYLIEHPKGLVLIDTSWHAMNRTKPFKNLALAYPIYKADLPEGQAVHEHIEQLGYQVSDIDYVVLSHLHCDHADGLRHVSTANHILVSQEELDAANHNTIGYAPHQWENINIDTFTFTHNGIGPTGKSFDLFDDGTIEFVHTPGHSMGQCAARIKAHKEDNAFLLLASDAAYASKSWDYGILPGLVNNKEETINSLNWIKSQATHPQCIQVLANHDPDIKPQIFNL